MRCQRVQIDDVVLEQVGSDLVERVHGHELLVAVVVAVAVFVLGTGQLFELSLLLLMKGLEFEAHDLANGVLLRLVVLEQLYVGLVHFSAVFERLQDDVEHTVGIQVEAAFGSGTLLSLEPPTTGARPVD